MVVQGHCSPKPKSSRTYVGNWDRNGNRYSKLCCSGDQRKHVSNDEMTRHIINNDDHDDDADDEVLLSKLHTKNTDMKGYESAKCSLAPVLQQAWW